MSKKAFFFDRDGIVNKRKMGGYIQTPEEFVFNEDFFDVFSKVAQKGYLKIIITNQQGIGKGLMSESALNEIHGEMQRILREKTGDIFDGIYYCGDLDGTSSTRRKPAPGMLIEAIQDFDIEANESWMLGDSPSDVQAGKAAGCKTILIGDYPSKFPDADYVYESLHEMSQKIEFLLTNNEVEQ